MDGILNYVNIFLEIFGECNIFDEDLEIMAHNIKKVNWKIFPSGHLDPDFFINNVNPVLSTLSEEKQKVCEYRFNFIIEKEPKFIAIGEGGFRGYIVFGFPEKHLYILESLYQGNATYVFDENWETLSKRTKGEILSENLQKDRFIHRKNWKRYINSLFREGYYYRNL